ncbi:MAG: hypothetical protein OEV45_03270 [Desulfobacteraceae bacterium]|nr:hypothetical protein [Desulfobacteraceae bacterium]
MTKSKKKLYDLRHEQVTVHNVIREKKVAEYDIKDDQDHLRQSFEVFFIRTYLKNNLSAHGSVAKRFKMLTYYVYAPLFLRFAPCPEP